MVASKINLHLADSPQVCRRRRLISLSSRGSSPIILIGSWLPPSHVASIARSVLRPFPDDFVGFWFGALSMGILHSYLRRSQISCNLYIQLC